MADLSPFLSTPGEWVERLAELREQRKKLEAQEERLRGKIEGYLASEKIDHVAGEKFIARMERRESVDFSQGALAEEFGAAWLVTAKDRLPKRVTESLAIRPIKIVEESKEGQDLRKELSAHFSGPAPSTKPERKNPWKA